MLENGPPALAGGSVVGSGSEPQAHAVGNDVLVAALAADDLALAKGIFETEIGESDRRPDQIDLAHQQILVEAAPARRRRAARGRANHAVQPGISRCQTPTPIFERTFGPRDGSDIA